MIATVGVWCIISGLGGGGVRVSWRVVLTFRLVGVVATMATNAGSSGWIGGVGLGWKILSLASSLRLCWATGRPFSYRVKRVCPASKVH